MGSLPRTTDWTLWNSFIGLSVVNGRATDEFVARVGERLHIRLIELNAKIRVGVLRRHESLAPISRWD
jgi:hypothetical protein